MCPIRAIAGEDAFSQNSSELSLSSRSHRPVFEVCCQDGLYVPCVDCVKDFFTQQSRSNVCVVADRLEAGDENVVEQIFSSSLCTQDSIKWIYAPGQFTWRCVRWVIGAVSLGKCAKASVPDE